MNCKVRFCVTSVPLIKVEDILTIINNYGIKVNNSRLTKKTLDIFGTCHLEKPSQVFIKHWAVEKELKDYNVSSKWDGVGFSLTYGNKVF